MPLISFLNLSLSLASLFILAATIALAVDYFVYGGKYFSRLLERTAWPLIMLLTSGSVVLSLLYSEYFGFIPCSLCWLQRIAIYPQALLSIIAYRTRDTINFPSYGIALSMLGFVVAVYQYIYQMIPAEIRESGALPCLADGTGADCASKVIDLFGFVTFPFISAVTFAFLIMVYLYLRRATTKS